MGSNKEFDQLQYQNEYNKQNYDRITIMVPKGDKERITAAAKAAGYKSRNEFILAAIREKMGKDRYDCTTSKC